jgi:hypothetical protein
MISRIPVNQSGLIIISSAKNPKNPRKAAVKTLCFYCAMTAISSRLEMHAGDPHQEIW